MVEKIPRSFFGVFSALFFTRGIFRYGTVRDKFPDSVRGFSVNREVNELINVFDSGFRE